MITFQSCESQTKVEHPWVIIASAAGCRVSCVKQLGCLALQVARFTCLMIPKVELHMLSHCLIQVGMKNYMNCHELHTIDMQSKEKLGTKEKQQHKTPW